MRHDRARRGSWRAGLATVALGLALASCAPVSPDSTDPDVAPAPSAPAAPEALDISRQLSVMEDEYAARLGVSAVDLGTGDTVSYRADERFGFASTLKVFAAAEFLRRTPPPDRAARVRWTQEDIDRAGYSPVTSGSVDSGAPLTALAEAAVRFSDNTAFNLVLASMGGPGALRDGLALLGDSTSEVVHDEPELNDVDSGGTADTTTPAAFGRDLATLLAPDHLAAEDRDLLLGWMTGNSTGDTLIRAGVPADWTVADKSGGAGPIRNDIAIVTRPGRSALVVAIFSERTDPGADYDDSLVARAAATVVAELR